MANEVKRFSKTVQKSKLFNESIRQGSVSDKDAANRLAVYEKVFSNFEKMKEITKQFSGYSETPLISNQYFDASVISYATSFAGHLSIERDMDNAHALLYFLDLLQVADPDVTVLPNIGQESIEDLDARLTTNVSLTDATQSYSVNMGSQILPNSVVITLVDGSTSTTYEVKDDGNGNLTAQPGVLDGSGTNSVNYSTGVINFSIDGSNAFTVVAAEDTVNVTTYADSSGIPETGTSDYYKNRFKLSMNNVLVKSHPDMLIGENNLVSLAGMQKTLGANAQDVLSSKLIELYTKIINKKLVSAIHSDYAGDNVTVDIRAATTGFSNFRSVVDLLSARLVDIDTSLAKKSTKGVRATAYVCGTKAAGWLKKTKSIGQFTVNTSSNYINDLIGYFDGVPVMRHTDLPDKVGYAVHKTSDGNLAPVMRGVFLPLTDTPAVGNYDNPTQIAKGVFYQEATKKIASALVQKFEVEDGS